MISTFLSRVPSSIPRNRFHKSWPLKSHGWTVRVFQSIFGGRGRPKKTKGKRDFKNPSADTLPVNYNGTFIVTSVTSSLAQSLIESLSKLPYDLVFPLI